MIPTERIKELIAQYERINFTEQVLLLKELLEYREAEEQSMDSRVDTEFARGAREGWMRAIVFYLDINAEAKEAYKTEMEKRWPLTTPTKGIHEYADYSSVSAVMTPRTELEIETGMVDPKTCYSPEFLEAAQRQQRSANEE